MSIPTGHLPSIAPRHGEPYHSLRSPTRSEQGQTHSVILYEGLFINMSCRLLFGGEGLRHIPIPVKPPGIFPSDPTNFGDGEPFLFACICMIYMYNHVPYRYRYCICFYTIYIYICIPRNRCTVLLQFHITS